MEFLAGILSGVALGFVRPPCLPQESVAKITSRGRSKAKIAEPGYVLDYPANLVSVPRKHRRDGKRTEEPAEIRPGKQLFCLSRIDPRQIDGIDVLTAMTVKSEGDET